MHRLELDSGRTGGRLAVVDVSSRNRLGKRGWDSSVAGGRQTIACTVQLVRTKKIVVAGVGCS